MWLKTNWPLVTRGKKLETATGVTTVMLTGAEVADKPVLAVALAVSAYAPNDSGAVVS